MLIIREAKREDLIAITEIYNDAIIKTVATFDTQPKSMEEQRVWFDKHNAKYPILVVEDQHQVVGWASLNMWSDRCGYSDTAEISLYIEEGHRNRGIGRKLLEAILKKGKNAGLHVVIARIAETNQTSVHLCENYGFIHIGTMREVGRKFGKLLDVHLMEKIFDSPHGIDESPH